MNAVTALGMPGPGPLAAGVAGEPDAEGSAFGALLEAAVLGGAPPNGAEQELVGAADIVAGGDPDDREMVLPEVPPPSVPALGVILPTDNAERSAPTISNSSEDLPGDDEVSPTAAGDRPGPPGPNPVTHLQGSGAAEPVERGRVDHESVAPPATLDTPGEHHAPDQGARVVPEATPVGDRTGSPPPESTPVRSHPAVEPPPPSRPADVPQVAGAAASLDSAEGPVITAVQRPELAVPTPTVAAPPVAPPPPSAPSAAATPPTGVSLPPVEDPNVARIGGAIRTIQRGETRVTTVSLRPAELGHVRIELHEEGGRLAIRMLPSSPEAREVLRVAEGALRRELAGSGVQLERIEVEVGSGGGDPRRGQPAPARFEDAELPAAGWPVTVRRSVAPSARAMPMSTTGLEVDL